MGRLLDHTPKTFQTQKFYKYFKFAILNGKVWKDGCKFETFACGVASNCLSAFALCYVDRMSDKRETLLIHYG